MRREDGRNVDGSLGALSGEGSDQRVARSEERLDQLAREAWNHVPTRPAPGARAPNETYYDRPVVKQTVWKWYVPAYFYAGGVSGAAATLGAIARAIGGGGMTGLVKRCRVLAAAGGAAGTAFLILDLGRPERFLNMLRVFRPTSPMSVGSFVLAAEAPLAAGSAALALAGRAPAVADVAGAAAGVLGLPMSTYTAVLVSNSSTPVWRAMHTSLPWLFAASAVTGATALLDLMDLNEAEERAVTRLGVAAKAAELAAATAVEREASTVGRVGAPLHDGLSGALWKAAKAATAASLAISLMPGRTRWKRTAAGALATSGAVATRFAIWRAGVASARDPRATFEQQRARDPQATFDPQRAR